MEVLIQYLPSIIISILNLIIPELFIKLAEIEEFTNTQSTRITIVRLVEADTDTDKYKYKYKNQFLKNQIIRI